MNRVSRSTIFYCWSISHISILDLNLTHLSTGLEFIVDRLKNPTKPDTASPSLDITCVVCGLDFSPEWEKTDFEDKFECYYCFTSKLRKTVIIIIIGHHCFLNTYFCRIGFTSLFSFEVSFSSVNSAL